MNAVGQDSPVFEIDNTAPAGTSEQCHHLHHFALQFRQQTSSRCPARSAIIQRLGRRAEMISVFMPAQ